LDIIQAANFRTLEKLTFNTGFTVRRFLQFPDSSCTEKNIGNIQETDSWKIPHNLETADFQRFPASGCRIAASSKRPMERILIFVIQSVLIGDGSPGMKSSDKLHVCLE